MYIFNLLPRFGKQITWGGGEIGNPTKKVIAKKENGFSETVPETKVVWHSLILCGQINCIFLILRFVIHKCTTHRHSHPSVKQKNKNKKQHHQQKSGWLPAHFRVSKCVRASEYSTGIQI